MTTPLIEELVKEVSQIASKKELDWKNFKDEYPIVKDDKILLVYSAKAEIVDLIIFSPKNGIYECITHNYPGRLKSEKQLREEEIFLFWTYINLEEFLMNSLKLPVLP